MKFSSTWMWVTVLVIIWTLLTVTVWAQGQTPEPTPAPANDGPALAPAPENQSDGQPAGNGEARPGGDGQNGEKKEGEGGDPGDQGDQGGGNGGLGGFFGNPMMLGLIAIAVLMIFMSSRNRKKQEAKRKEMLAAIKPGEKVMTIGGLIGTVSSAKEDEIVVKSGDQKLTFARWAIRTVGDDVKTEKADDKQEQK